MKIRNTVRYNPFIDPELLDDPITEIYSLLSHLNIGDPKYEQRSSLIFTHTTMELKALNYYVVNANPIILKGLKASFKMLQYATREEQEEFFTNEDIDDVCSFACLGINVLQADDELKRLIDQEIKHRRQ